MLLVAAGTVVQVSDGENFVTRPACIICFPETRGTINQVEERLLGPSTSREKYSATPANWRVWFGFGMTKYDGVATYQVT